MDTPTGTNRTNRTSRTSGGDPAPEAVAWAASGMMALTGRAGGPPLGAPTALVGGAWRLAGDIARHSGRLGCPVVVDPLALMAERAAVSGLRRAGTVSCGGGTHLLRARDGWVAVTLARETDWELVPALLELTSAVDTGNWGTVASGVAGRRAEGLRDRAALLGLPLAVLGERAPSGGRPGAGTGSDGLAGTAVGVRSRRLRRAGALGSLDRLEVVDLSSLWAGPLVGRLLVQAGARVVKVESPDRPDGSRRGDPRFGHLMNAGKESVAVDMATPAGRRRLVRMVGCADVVITASRARALDQLGLDVDALVREGRPRLWLRISGYGSSGPSSDRVAFGDDAAVAGGLVARDGTTPCFCGDAIADPLCGLAAAAAVFTALADDGAWVVDASMADVAGGMTGDPFDVDGLEPADPRPPDPPGPGEPRWTGLGADTATVVRRWGLDPPPGPPPPPPGPSPEQPAGRRMGRDGVPFGTLRE